MYRMLYRAKCNGCGTQTNPFGKRKDLQNYLDNIAGWKSTKNPRAWVHLCPKCRKELDQ